MGFPGGSVGKASATMWETRVRSLGQEDALEKGMATHASIFAWRIPRIEVRVQGVLPRVTNTFTFTGLKTALRVMPGLLGRGALCPSQTQPQRHSDWHVHGL